MLKIRNKQLLLYAIFFLLLVVFVLVISQKESIGKSIWASYKNPTVSLIFNNNSQQALEIGNYYFNVYGDGVYDLEKAQKYFYKAIELDPLVPDAWHQLARIDFLNGDFASALTKIDKQIDLHGDTFMAAYYISGLIHGFSENYEDAESDFKKFLEWDPINWAIYNDLAWVYFSQGSYTKVVDVAKQGLEIFPDNPWLLNMYGVGLMNLDMKEEAHNQFIKALEKATLLTVDDWHTAYPGNHPGVAEKGLSEMRKSIKENINLVVSK